MYRSEINTFHHFQVVEFFDSEADAEYQVAKFLRKHDYHVDEQVTLPSGRRIDLIASNTFDGCLVTLPIEIKPHLYTAGDFAAAAFQAQSYSQELGLPVFVGPVIKTVEAEGYGGGGQGSENFPVYQNGIEFKQSFVSEQVNAFNTRLNNIMSFMCRMNVGIFMMRQDGQSYSFRTEPSPSGFVTGRSAVYEGGYKTEFRPKYWGMREASGSNSRMKRFVE